MMKSIDLARLRSLLAYDPQSGEIRWIVDRGNSSKLNHLAGTLTQGGYRVIEVDGSAFKAHRIAWALYYGGWPKCRLDHINRDPADNRINNLREATHAQNIANTRSKMSGRRKGVYWHKQRKCWHSNITIGGKKKHLGLFNTMEEASIAFEQASSEIYGKFVCVEAKL